MTQEERDDVLVAIYVQLSRIYDLLLVGPEADRKLISEEHAKGHIIGPPPMMMQDDE